MNLREVIASLQADPEGGYRAEPSADWRQGRTLYGGITTALCLQAARLALGEAPPPLRAVQHAFIGPAAGRIRFVPTVLRRGRSVSFIGVDGVGDEGMCARSLFAFGLPRDSELAHESLPHAPSVPAPAECPVVRHATGELAAPPFVRHLEMRAAGGAELYSGAAPELLWWVRHRDGAGVDPTVALIAIADALPPAAAVASSQPRPVSSVTWSLDLAEPTEASATDWLLLHSVSEHAADGYSLQTMSCWDRAGRPLARERQLVAVF